MMGKDEGFKSTSRLILAAGTMTILSLAILLMKHLSDEAQKSMPLSTIQFGRIGSGSGDIDRVLIAPDVFFDLVWIPDGQIRKCSEWPNSDSAEARVRGFWIGRFEVTQRQWTAVMKQNPSPQKGDDLPVYDVSWNDVQQFLRRVQQGFRLPTEVEWEFAAQGNAEDIRSSLSEFAWHGGNSSGVPHPVGQKKSNRFGLHDCLGNVFEWCSDVYDPNSDSVVCEDDFSDHAGHTTEGYWPEFRVVRGGDWLSDARDVRANHRGAARVDSKGRFGFRIARSAGEQQQNESND